MSSPRTASPAATAEGGRKWLTASVVDDAREVIARVFDEAERRDARHGHPWVALVDGNNHQIDRIRAEAAARNLEVAIVVDVVHVLEYLWSAAWSFFAEGDPDAEAWVGEKALAVLEGRASIVAASIRRKATTSRSSPPSGPTPTVAPTTCSPRRPTSTTRPPWPAAGRSPRA